MGASSEDLWKDQGKGMIVAITVLLSFAILYFYNLGFNETWMPNEALTADGVREIFRGAPLLAPPFNGEPFLHKPPMTQWISSLGVLLFGMNEFGIRFFHAVLSILTAIVTALFAKEFFDWRTSFLAGLVFLTSAQIFSNARMSTPEIPFTFFVTLSLYLWFLGYSRKRDILILLAFLISSLGMLTKWLPGLLIPMAVGGLYLVFRNPKEIFRRVYLAGILIALVPFGIWFLYMVINYGSEFLSTFYYENFKRVYGIQSDPVYLHLITIPATFFPYSFIVYIGTLWAFLGRRRELLLFTIWFLVILIVFSLVTMKLPTYMMPAFPAMAIITAHYLREGVWERINTYSVYLILFLGALALFGMAFLTTTEIIPLILSFALLPLSLKAENWIRPAFAGLALTLYTTAISLPYIESFRHQREIGEIVRFADQENKRNYFIAGSHFFESQPYYSKRRVDYVGSSVEKVKPGSIVLLPSSLKEKLPGCYILWSGRLYADSESQFFRFLMGIKKGKGMEDYYLCLVPS